MNIEPVAWESNRLKILDQRRLPDRVEYINCLKVEEVAEAIETLAVRGAPAIGVAAAYGMAIAAYGAPQGDISSVHKAHKRLSATRPTAVNLFWALDRSLKKAVDAANGGNDIFEALLKEANLIKSEDIASNMRLGIHGAKLLRDGQGVLTHCNAGALATAGYGTALGIIRAARESGKQITVYADETRPILQGSRLTAWELYMEGFDVTLICGNMAAWVMKKGFVHSVIVGADRIALNGDTANKIGTYSLAINAGYHNIPFYIAAPLSTFDRKIVDGDSIPVEERNPDEVRSFLGFKSAPAEVKCFNPAFDVTPASLITAIITPEGVLFPPFRETIFSLFQKRD